jgi:hypothetical protein
MSADTRTRSMNVAGPHDPSAFWTGEWRAAIARNGQRASEDAARLGLHPLSITVDGETWTLAPGRATIDVGRGRAADACVELTPDAFADLFCERRTALGLVIGGRVDGDPAANDAFCAWDPVLRSALDGRSVYRSGDVSLRARDGSLLALDQQFRLGERNDDDAAHFLNEAGFLLVQDVFTDEEMDAVDADLARAVERARPDDGSSWWAATRAGEHYPCRILDFAQQSPSLRALIADPRYQAIGDLLGDAHRPGDPFGEHFADVTAEGLLKRIDSVEGLACLPWHKDCDRGGHSMFCSGITVGICLTPVDDAHGGLDVMAGSHRANIARAQIDRSLDLPAVTLRARRGDVTVHMSCTLHRSTHPTTHERRVAYTGFALPPRGDDAHEEAAQPRLRRERAAIGDPNSRPRLASEER